jgi:serine protease AprX
MSHPLALPCRIRWGLSTGASTAMLAVLVVLAALSATGLERTSASNAVAGVSSPSLVRLADAHPGRSVEVIVQFENGVSQSGAQKFVRSNGGRVTGELPIINGLAVSTTAGKADRLASEDGVRAVSLNGKVRKSSLDAEALATSYNQSIQSPKAWGRGATGEGVGVAIIDTGIAGDLADFRNSQGDSASRVVSSAVINPDATNAGDSYGHGTHVAGIIGGNGFNRSSSDPLYGKYAGVAPDADLINVKIADEQGNSTVLDAIYGLQFVVDHKDDYNIRVVNLSFESTSAQSYKTDPLDAAAEAAWFSGIVVVAAAGNRGSDSDAVSHAPGNDPYVITVGAADDQGTKQTADDSVASWSSRGLTQDGIAKPDVVAPGAHIVSNLAPNSEFTSLCPSCVTAGEYIRAGGTSMAAPMVAGAVADLLQAHPGWTPDQVKGVLARTDRTIPGGDQELSLNAAVALSGTGVTSNEGLTPNTLIDPSTGQIDYSRSSWSRSSWSRSSWSRSSWSRSSWSCSCPQTGSGSIDPSRSSWSRSSWSRSSWSRSSWSTSWTK